MKKNIDVVLFVVTYSTRYLKYCLVLNLFSCYRLVLVER